MQLLRRLKFTLLLMSLMTLVACGGSGGDITGGGNGGGTETVTLQLAKSDGNLSGTNDITIGAKVMQGNSVVANKLVTFVLTDPTLATFDPAVGTAVTDSDGIATILVKATNIPGGVEVTATISEIDPVSIGFTSEGGGPGGSTGTMMLTLSKSEGDLSGDNDISLSATVKQGANGVAGKLVTFELSNPTLATFEPSVGTAVTNSNGVATIILKATSIAGGIEVNASIGDLEPVVIGFNSLGGGAGGGTGAITLSLTKSEGDLSGDNDISISAAVMQDANAVVGQLVTFKLSNPNLATFMPEVGTAVTNSEGIAIITLKATNIPGGVEVVVSVTDVDPVTISFTSLGGGPSIDTGAIVLSLTKSNGDLSGDNDVIISATVMQDTLAIANKLVTFELSDPNLATFLPEVGTAVTNDEGVATITLKATNIAGGLEVTATVADVAPVSIGFTSIGGGPGGEGGEPVADSISLFASTQQIASSGAQTVTLTAIAKDGNNNLLEGVRIIFSADSGALEKVLDNNGQSSDVTGPDGKLSRKLSTLAEATNRIITTTITNGTASDTLDVQVVGTTVSLTGSTSLALNDPNSFIIKLLDSDGNGLANQLVTLSIANTPSDEFADITIPPTVTTDFNGQATISVIGESGGTNTIVASALGANAEKNVSVQADSFLFTQFDNSIDGSGSVNLPTGTIPDVLLKDKATITLTWLRSNAPVVNGKVSFTSTRGSLNVSSILTDSDGKATVEVFSDNAGKVLVTFTGTDTDNGETIELNNQLEFEFVADTAERLIAQAYPKSIGPNAQTSTISVVVRDVTGNLVKNKVVDFVLTDTNGGAIFPASAVTDSNGSASTVYTSASTSANNGVSIKALVRDTPTVDDTVTLTVADREVFIALGTGNSIENVDETTYNKKYSVFVTDIDSNPVPNVNLTVSAIPSEYAKGIWEKQYEDGEFTHYAAKHFAVCPNEDIDNDGILSGTEDTNRDDKLTPGNIVNAQGEVTTDAQGRAIIDITYAEVFGHWAYINLIVSTKVNGTESYADALFVLPVAGEDVTKEDNPPASFLGGTSPFGYAALCTDSN